MDTRTYKLVYYDIRGLAEPIRWMFQIANVAFEDVRVPLNNWTEERSDVGLVKSVGQLPVLCIDDKIQLSQPHSVLRYVAKQLGFNGESEMDAIRADEVVELLYELRMCVVTQKQLFTDRESSGISQHTVFRDLFNEKNLSRKVLIKKTLVDQDFPKYLDKINTILQQSDGPYLAGQKITYADLAFANFIDICETTVNPDLLNDYPDLYDIKEEILDIPAVQNWLEISGGKNLDFPSPPPTIGA